MAKRSQRHQSKTVIENLIDKKMQKKVDKREDNNQTSFL